MKICTDHWAKCCDAIELRGLSHLVAKSGEEALSHAVAQLEGEAKPEDYDPLASLAWMIMGRAIQTAGLGILGKNPSGANDGEYCPLCEARAAYDYHAGFEGGRCGDANCTIVVAPGSQPWDENMVGGASDAILKHCRETGLVPPVC